ncbi:SusC/RagA family TonB-linked outer membrane protein [Gabonibacter massiliensis]|uniref:SusC/RagA family TonB-linked outer membrane protein n=1 Tax=Gabonibacter massiliensis TaxID=1720195 RepID=UPI0009E7B3CB|nr:SusC/RagA family TonB-linked outer membrane protein [Gabonibacter massiliensis]
MKKNGIGVFDENQRLLKMRFIFKRCVLLLFMSVFFLQVNAGQQVVKLTMNMKDATIDEIITNMSKETSYRFLYQVEEVLKYGKRDLNVKNAALEEVLNQLLKGTSLSYEIQNDVVIITPVKEEKKEDKKRVIKGKVIDIQKVPLPGVTVVIKGTTLGVSTDLDGKFTIEIPKQDTTILVFTFIGMEKVEHRLSKDPKDDEKELVITMKEEVKEVDEVVVTGYANIKKESFTGSSVSIKREELLKVSKTNVIKALSTFDPSFRIQQSNQWGSDPNAVPEMYIRGRSGIGVKDLDKDALSKSSLKNNPNLPVFIMDGFEVSVQKVYDMDPMRIENVQILKDASATAMYGSRAANGVVVITTVAPKPGEVVISYSLTGEVSMPDLTDYNLANAAEKLEIEMKSGLFDPNIAFQGTWMQAMNAYNERLVRVKEGVTTDWLALPLRNAFKHKHTLSVEGGNKDLRYGLDVSYKNDNGVMKDSYRDNLDLGFHVDYRIGNWLQVVNYIEYTYTDAQDSPYGDFSDYAHLQPYDRPYDKQGNLIQKLEFSKKRDNTNYGKNNPLYEALLNNFQYDKSDTFIERLMAQVYITDYFHLKGQFAITKFMSKNERFIDPKSSKITSTEYMGDLYITKGDETKWDAQIGAYFTKVFGNAHALNASLVMNATNTKTESTSSHYRGFPSGEYHSPNFAAEVYNKPSKSENLTRLVGFLLLANYTWNDIYLADLSVRFDGSSEFGLDQKWAPFWSGGLGINVHNYSFLKNNEVITRLKLRGSYGQTGKTNFAPYNAKTIYKTFDRWYISGFGVGLRALGNKDLKWETTNKMNIGTDLGFWGDRIVLNFDYYHDKTVDLITDVTLPGSSGFPSYKSNLGETLNEGFDIRAQFDIIKSKDWYLNIWGNLTHNKNKILKVSDALKQYNSQVDDYYADAEVSQQLVPWWDKTMEEYAKPLMKYEEGASLTSIYGVRSLGIDPTTGKELYLYRNGQVSGKWKSSQQVVLGDTEPDASGSFGVNATYKGVSLFVSFAYDWGKQIYNETLVNSVENADIENSNVDKRVLTQRWEKPGDIAPLKDIKNRDAVTLPTSRFVQDENVLSLSTLTLGYDFNQDLLRKIYLRTLNIEFQMNDIFRLSSVKQERGTSYPFARSINFTLRATF